MHRKSRLSMFAASVLLIGLFFVPMWSITLEAPQYPKGNELGILISINKIRGANEFDLQNLNGLNHYIGMKPIEEDAIPELEYMPMIVGVLIASGVLTAVIGKRKLIVVWLVLLIAAGALGMYDFYLWEYDYGHNLDSRAPIKVPGMSYQPPLLGSKQLLNITAYSCPSVGFYLIIVSSALAGLAWWNPKQRE